MSRPLAGKKVQAPVSVIDVPETAVTCSTDIGQGLSAFAAAGAGAEGAGAAAAGAAAGAAALLSPPPQAAVDTNTIAAHLDRTCPDIVITRPPIEGWSCAPAAADSLPVRSPLSSNVSGSRP